MESRRFVDPIAYERRDTEKSRPGPKRKHKLNRRIKSNIGYRRRWKPKHSKLNTGAEKYIFLFRYKGVVRFISDKYSITPNAVEFLVAAYSFDYFFMNELLDICFLPKTFSNKEWPAIKENGLVQIYKTMRHADGTGNLYALSYKGNRVVNRFYKILLGQEELPTYVE